MILFQTGGVQRKAGIYPPNSPVVESLASEVCSSQPGKYVVDFRVHFGLQDNLSLMDDLYLVEYSVLFPLSLGNSIH